MQRSEPFARARAMMAAIAAVMSLSAGFEQRAKLDALGPYVSRGKGGKTPSRHVGVKAHARAATKARNVRRNRRAHRS